MLLCCSGAGTLLVMARGSRHRTCGWAQHCAQPCLFVPAPSWSLLCDEQVPPSRTSPPLRCTAASSPPLRFIHEYQLTPHSLYAAVSIGLEMSTIVGVLSRLSKNVLPPEIRAFVKGCTQNYGKVRLHCSRLAACVTVCVCMSVGGCVWHRSFGSMPCRNAAT